MERADIYQIAKNCRTSVGMIEKYYAVHINIFTRRRCHQCDPLEKRPVGGRRSISETIRCRQLSFVVIQFPCGLINEGSRGERTGGGPVDLNAV
jgi:hypothetical protein